MLELGPFMGSMFMKIIEIKPKSLRMVRNRLVLKQGEAACLRIIFQPNLTKTKTNGKPEIAPKSFETSFGGCGPTARPRLENYSFVKRTAAEAGFR